MEVEQGAKQSLYPVEEQFFSFCPVQFVDDVYNLVDDYLSDGTDAVEKSIMAALGVRDKEDKRYQAIRKECDAYIVKLRGIFDRNFDKFEMYVLRNIFRIPDDLSLTSSTASQQQAPQIPEDISEIGLDPNWESVDEDALDAELQQLAEKLHKERETYAHLRAESSILDRNLERFEIGAKRLAGIHTTFKGSNDVASPTILEIPAAHIKALSEVLERMAVLRSRLVSRLGQAEQMTDEKDLDEIFQDYNAAKKSVGGASTEALSAWCSLIEA